MFIMQFPNKHRLPPAQATRSNHVNVCAYETKLVAITKTAKN